MYRKVHSYHYDVPYRAQSVESLATLSSRVAATYISYDLRLIRELSPAAKTTLVNILGKRNHLTVPVLRVLAHRDLESICLSGHLVRDSAVSTLSITKLRSLQVPENEISPPGLLRLFHSLPYLQELDISSCLSVTDEVLETIADNCSKLQMINLGKCVNFSDSGLSQIASSLCCLVILDISYTQVTDASLKALAEGPSKHMLRELHIDGCRRLTSDCGQFLQMLPNITILSFYDCPCLLKSDWFENCNNDHQRRRMKNVSFTIE